MTTEKRRIRDLVSVIDNRPESVNEVVTVLAREFLSRPAAMPGRFGEESAEGSQERLLDDVARALRGPRASNWLQGPRGSVLRELLVKTNRSTPFVAECVVGAMRRGAAAQDDIDRVVVEHVHRFNGGMSPLALASVEPLLSRMAFFATARKNHLGDAPGGEIIAEEVAKVPGSSGGPAMTRMLAHYGADIDEEQVTSRGRPYTPLSAAIDARQADVAQWLLKEGASPEKAVRMLLTRVDEDDRGLFRFRARALSDLLRQVPESADRFLKEAVRLNRGFVEDMLASNVACWWDTPAQLSAQMQEVVMAIIKAGADVNARGSWERTALFCAQGSAATRCLLAAGADPYIEDRHGATPWSVAWGRPAVMEALLRGGLDLDRANSDGETARRMWSETDRGRELVAAHEAARVVPGPRRKLRDAMSAT